MFRKLLSASILLLGISGQVSAQTNPPRDPGQQSAAAGTSIEKTENIDQKVAACLVLANANELAIADFAQGRIQDAQVEEFVSMLVSEHEEALSKIRSFAPQFAELGNEIRAEARKKQESESKDSGDTTAKGDVRPSTPPNMRTGTIPAKNADTWFEIEKAAAGNCRQMMIEELSQHSGAEFDKAFLGAQVGVHIHMISRLEAVQPYVSEQMRPLIDDCLASTQKHLERARELCEGMKDGAASKPDADR